MTTLSELHFYKKVARGPGWGASPDLFDILLITLPLSHRESLIGLKKYVCKLLDTLFIYYTVNL
jgi:hypothetical protein